MLTNFLVTTTDDTVADDGAVSLREAISAADGDTAANEAPAGEADGDVIRFSDSLTTREIDLTSGSFAITDDLLINGSSSAGRMLIRASGTRIFDINTSESVVFAGLNLREGRADHGGAIRASGGGETTIRDSSIRTSQADRGGAVYNDTGTLVIRESRLGGNTAFSAGGAVFNGAGASLLVFHSTISDNRVSLDGGGIYQEGDGGYIMLRDVTLKGNRAAPPD